MTSTDYILLFAARLRRFRSAHDIRETKAARILREIVPPCPGCGAGLRHAGGHRLRCIRCARRTTTLALTPFRRMKVSARHMAQAVWHLVNQPDPISARMFGRRYQLRAQTAWRLLHVVRQALPEIQSTGATARMQVLGSQSKCNTAHVRAGAAGDCVVFHPDDDARETGQEPASPELQLELGYLRAWLVHTHRGVTRKWLHLYLLEWSYRRVQHKVAPRPVLA